MRIAKANFDLPRHHHFSARTLRDGRDAADRLSRLPRVPETVWRELTTALCLTSASFELPPSKLGARVDAKLASMRDYLSIAMWERYGNASYRYTRMSDEIASFDACKVQLIGSLSRSSGPWEFNAALHDLHRHLYKKDVGFRQTSVHIATIDVEDQVHFPPHECIEVRLAQIQKNLIVNAGHPLLAATVAYVSLIEIHPFEDGNGRLSRVLTNALMHGGDKSGEAYLPLKELNLLTRGSFYLNYMRAVVYGDWRPLLEFFISAIQLYELVVEAVAETDRVAMLA
nr:Fic family protein [Dyella sp. ASV24]